MTRCSSPKQRLQQKLESLKAEKINEAYQVLKDPVQKEIYDLTLKQPIPGVRESIALVIDLSNFTPHSTATNQTSTLPDEAEPEWYTHSCRCSGLFVITLEELERGIEIIQCDGCSERCRVDYQEEA